MNGSGRPGTDRRVGVRADRRGRFHIHLLRRTESNLRRSGKAALQESGELKLVTSALTLLEVLVVPLRAGNFLLAERYEALLTRGRGLRMVEIDRSQLRAAAQLRAVHRVRTPDAVQLTAALSAGCSAFVTNDRRLATPAGLRIVQLADHV